MENEQNKWAIGAVIVLFISIIVATFFALGRPITPKVLPTPTINPEPDRWPVDHDVKG